MAANLDSQEPFVSMRMSPNEGIRYHTPNPGWDIADRGTQSLVACQKGPVPLTYPDELGNGKIDAAQGRPECVKDN